jgi:hypothetical protein
MAFSKLYRYDLYILMYIKFAQKRLEIINNKKVVVGGTIDDKRLA